MHQLIQEVNALHAVLWEKMSLGFDLSTPWHLGGRVMELLMWVVESIVTRCLSTH